MQTGWWWLRLEYWTWINTWRVRPVRGTLRLALWVLPAVVVPVAVLSGGQQHSSSAFEWLLSIDMPLALALAAQVGVAVVALATRTDTEDWIAPVARRGMAGKALFVLRVLHAVRWALGLALAALLLWMGSRAGSAELEELLLIDGFAVLGGALFAWVLLGRNAAAPARPQVRTAAASGLAALSLVPLREARLHLHLRRLAALAIPVLLAATMGTDAQEVLRALVGWIGSLFVFNWMRQASHTTAVLRRWMPRMRMSRTRLNWFVWRYVLGAAVLGGIVLWLGWRVSAPRPPAAAP